MAEQRRPQDPAFTGVFLVGVSRASAPVWPVQRYPTGRWHRVKKYAFVNHYFFHLVDPEWGHVTVRMSGHPPFGAWVILNGHEWVECQARKEGLVFVKEGNAFTQFSDGVALSRVAETLSAERTVGRLRQVCDRWIYSACLCFALSSPEQARSGFRFDYSVVQAEYSRNLLYRRGPEMDPVHQGLIDRTRRPLDVRTVTTLFGRKHRPYAWKKTSPAHRPRLQKTVETLSYDLTVFKVHCGDLTLKIYDKGERLQRVEAIAHSIQALRRRKGLENFPRMLSELQGMAVRFLNVLRQADVSFLDAGALDDLPMPTTRGARRLAGVDIQKPRMRAVLEALLALGPQPRGFSVEDLSGRVRATTGWTDDRYGPRQAGYDLAKVQGKGLVEKIPSSRRYVATAKGYATMAALLVLREKVLKPVLAGLTRRPGRPPKNTHPIDVHYQNLRLELQKALETLGVAA